MPTTIDELQIEINAKASSANAALDNLIDQIDRLSKSLKGFEKSSVSEFGKFINRLEKLSKINITGLGTVTKSIEDLTRAFSNMGAANGAVSTLGNLFKSISKLGNKSITNAITNIPVLATELSKLLTVLSQSPNVSNNVVKLISSISTLSNKGIKFSTSSKAMTRGFDGIRLSANRASKSTFSLASAFGKFYASYFLVIRGIKGLWNSINSTADYMESFNYYIVSFRKIASEWDSDWDNYGSENARSYSNAFVTTMNKTFKTLSGVSYDPEKGLLSETGLKNLGLNLQEVTRYAAQLASMMNAVGHSGESTIATTNAFVKLAGDISSLYNIDYSDAASSIRSVLQGQSRAGYRFGWDTTMASLQATADKLNLSKAVSEMTQMEKQQLRILTILEQSKVAWGDQANTIASLSNQIRLLKNNLSEAGILLGQLFAPMLEKVLPLINGISIAIKRLLSDIAGILGIRLNPQDFATGFDGAENEIDGVTDSLDELTEASKKAKAGLRGFDELNVINMGDTSATASSGLGSIDLTEQILKATEKYNKVWQDAYDQMENRAQEFADRIGVYFEPIKKLISDIRIGDWFAVGQDVSGIATSIFDFFSNAIANVDWYNVGVQIGNFLNGVDWDEIMRSVGDAAWEALKAAINLWSGMFKQSPFGTLAITFGAFSFLLGQRKMTGALFSSKLASAMGLTASTVSSFAFTVAATLAITWGLEHLISDEESPVRKWLNKNITPSENLSQKDIDETNKALNEFSFAKMFSWENIKRNLEESIFGNLGKSNAEALRGGGSKRRANEIGQNIVDGIVEPIANSDTAISEASKGFLSRLEEGLKHTLKIHSPAQTMHPIGENILLGIVEGFEGRFGEFTETITSFYSKYVSPWFNKDKWTFGGIEEGLSISWSNAIETIESMWNNFATWLNDKLTWEIDPISIAGKQIFAGTTISLGKIPTFYNGGFVPNTADLFMANENGIPELVGTVGGRTAVASGSEITGIRDTIYNSHVEEMALMRQQNEILMGILSKEFGITQNDIGRAARNYAREYTERTKKPAYSF